MDTTQIIFSSRDPFDKAAPFRPAISLVAEIIAIQIRSDANIKGINIDNTFFKISLMADDTYLIIKDITSISAAIEHF